MGFVVCLVVCITSFIVLGRDSHRKKIFQRKYEDSYNRYSAFRDAVSTDAEEERKLRDRIVHHYICSLWNTDDVSDIAEAEKVITDNNLMSGPLYDQKREDYIQEIYWAMRGKLRWNRLMHGYYELNETKELPTAFEKKIKELMKAHGHEVFLKKNHFGQYVWRDSSCEDY